MGKEIVNKKLSECGLKICHACKLRFDCIANVFVTEWCKDTLFIRLQCMDSVDDIKHEELPDIKCLDIKCLASRYSDIDRAKIQKMLGCDNNGIIKVEDWRF